MKKFLIDAGQIGYIVVETPDYIIEKLDIYNQLFNDWVGKQEKFKLKDEFGNIGLCFGYDDLIAWLNEIILVDSGQKVKTLKKEFYELTNEEKSLPHVII